jgi:hypothetical protein
MATRYVALTDHGPVRPVRDEPQAGYGLDVEIMPAF